MCTKTRSFLNRTRKTRPLKRFFTSYDGGLSILSLPEYQPEYLPEKDNKSYGVEPFEPDLTKGVIIPVSVPSCYEYPFSENGSSGVRYEGLQRTCSEHHYDVPDLRSANSHSLSSFTGSCKCNFVFYGLDTFFPNLYQLFQDVKQLIIILQGYNQVDLSKQWSSI